jgi:hypothetical protein
VREYERDKIHRVYQRPIHQATGAFHRGGEKVCDPQYRVPPFASDRVLLEVFNDKRMGFRLWCGTLGGADGLRKRSAVSETGTVATGEPGAVSGPWCHGPCDNSRYFYQADKVINISVPGTMPGPMPGTIAQVLTAVGLNFCHGIAPFSWWGGMP